MTGHTEEHRISLADERGDSIIDEAADDDAVLPLRYDITSFGIDFDVEGIVRRLNNDDVTVPDWQRSYVWSIKQASSFIESLLFGLPVPGIFLGRDSDSGQLYVIDGQQRLKTLQFFYSGRFNEAHKASMIMPFKLTGVDSRFEGLTFKDLSDTSRRKLNNSLIHATVVRQEAPPEDDTSMYQIFRRLNTGSNMVNPQEIRCAVYSGDLIDGIRLLNEYPRWREIAGKPSRRLKDQELILRFMAMWYEGNRYTKPMNEFLNTFTSRHREPSEQWLDTTSALFKGTIDAFAAAKARPFRLRESRAVNAAVFDSMTIGLAKRIANIGPLTSTDIVAVHESLIANTDYVEAVTQATSDESSVRQRLALATAAFENAQQ